MVLDLMQEKLFLFVDGSFAQNVIISGADMSSSVHANNKTKDILILDEDLAQGLDDTTLTAEKKYSINFTKSNTKFCLRLHYNGANSYLFVNGTEIHKFKAKDYKIEDYGVIKTSLCLRNTTKDFSAGNMKKIGLYGSVYGFSVDYKVIAVD